MEIVLLLHTRLAWHNNNDNDGDDGRLRACTLTGRIRVYLLILVPLSVQKTGPAININRK